MPYEDRHLYARLVKRCRYEESQLQISAIRQGLEAVLHDNSSPVLNSLWLLTPEELELRACGEPGVDLDVLKLHTVYKPDEYNEQSVLIQHFWKVLEGFSKEERSSFLQFAWARSRLPGNISDGNKAETDRSFRLLIIIQENKGDEYLPSSETCFFNVKLPKYSSFEVMRSKILTAICCRHITS